jgi:hypothetical protein
MSTSDPILAPALNELLRQFDALADEVQRDPSKLEAAQEHLGTITAVDAQGYIWGLNADGIFFRAVPNGQWEQADPTTFADAPSSAPSFTAPSFVSPTAPANPVLAHQSGWPPPDAARTFDPAHIPGATPAPVQHASHPYGDAYAHLQEGGKKKLRVKNPFASSKAPRDTSRAGQPGSLLEKMKGNKRAVIIGGILVFVVLVVVVEHGKSAAPTTPTTTTVTTLPPVTTTVPVTVATPSAAQENRAVALLETGRVTTASSAVATPGSSANRYFNAGVLYGFAHTGLTIRPVGAVTGGVQTWHLLRGTQVISSASVTWTHVPGGWKIAAWPMFATPAS